VEEHSRATWIRTALADYEAPLIRYAIRLLGDADRARDVVQETFLNLCQSDRSRVENHLAAWLFRVCRNRALDLRRKDKSVQPLETAIHDQIASPDPGPSALVETQQGAGKMLALVESLPENQREVIYLRFGAGLSYREISDVTGNTVSNVGVLIHNGVKKLRDQLATREGAAATNARSAK
jgi:RNA polymerase sigma-70 factor (ECF subfamily)